MQKGNTMVKDDSNDSYLNFKSFDTVATLALSGESQSSQHEI